MTDAPISVGRSLLSGGAWSVALRWTVRGIGLFNTFILAHLLVPSDFGLVAMATTVIGLVSVLGLAGQKMALIRHDAPTREHYDSVWTLTILVALAITLILCALSVPASFYFQEPRIRWLLPLLSLSVLFNGFENIGVVTFSRDLKFNRIFVYRLIIRVATTVITLGLAVWLRDWRALVGGILCGSVMGVATSYWIHPYRPRLCTTRIREVLSFSGWMLTISVSQYVNGWADLFAVGSLGKTSAMGTYSVSVDVGTAPTAETVIPATRALFPVFARIRNDPVALRDGYLNVLSVTCILSVAFGGGIALVAADFVRVVLGSQWTDAVPLVRVLAIAGGLFAIMQNGIPTLTATGHERLAARLTVSRAAVTLAGVGIAAALGNALTIAYARTLITLIFVPGTFSVLAGALSLTWGDMMVRIWRPFAAGAAMAAVVLSVHAASPDLPLLRLVLDSASGAVTYTVATIVLWVLAGRPNGFEASIVNWIASMPVAKSRHTKS